MSFAENLKNARIAAGMTQQELSDKLGIDRSAIAHYERGYSMPSVRKVLKICEILNVSFDKLTGNRFTVSDNQ